MWMRGELTHLIKAGYVQGRGGVSAAGYTAMKTASFTRVGWGVAVLTLGLISTGLPRAARGLSGDSRGLS